MSTSGGLPGTELADVCIAASDQTVQTVAVTTATDGVTVEIDLTERWLSGSYFISRAMSVPVMRQAYGGTQAPIQEDWWELFFDLIFIGVADMLGSAVDLALKEPTPGRTFFTIQTTFVFALMWFDFTLYFNRFMVKNDLYTTGALFLHSLSVVLMAVWIEELRQGLKYQFCLFAAVSEFSMILIHLPMSIRGSPQQKRFARSRIALFAISVCLWAINAVQPVRFGQMIVTSVIIIYSFAVLFLVTGPGFQAHPFRFCLPHNAFHLCDRSYVLVLIFLGDMVVKLIRPPPIIPTTPQMVALSLGFLLCLTIKQLGHDCAPRTLNENALYASKSRGIAFICLHMFLPFTLLSLGIGFNDGLLIAGSSTTPKHIVIVLTTSYVTVIAILIAMRRLHQFQRRSAVVWAFRIVLIAATAATLLTVGEHLPVLAVLGILSGSGTILAVSDHLGFDLPSHR